MLLDVPEEAGDLDGFAEAGVQHVIVGCAPFDLGQLRDIKRAAGRIDIG